MLTLKSKTKEITVEAEKGLSILDLALKYELDWGFSCTRGTCARCRCLVTEGMGALKEPSAAEEARLEPEEIEQGHRLACQAQIDSKEQIRVIHKPYF